MTTSIAALNSPQIKYAEFVQITNDYLDDTFCNCPSTITVNGITFVGIGSYMGISEIQQDMKSTSVDVKLTITGLTVDSIALVLSANLKGSTIKVWRGFLDSDNQIQTIGSVQQFFQRYQGIINNATISETFDQNIRERVATCVISSASMRYILDNRVAGIKTNPSNWQFLHPGDTSMNRVPVIASTYFNFGAAPVNGSASKVVGSTQQTPAGLVKFGN